MQLEEEYGKYEARGVCAHVCMHCLKYVHMNMNIHAKCKQAFQERIRKVISRKIYYNNTELKSLFLLGVEKDKVYVIPESKVRCMSLYLNTFYPC